MLAASHHRGELGRRVYALGKRRGGGSDALDIELFSVSAGGILEPQAEWTEKAHANLRDAFLTRKSALKVNFKPLPDDGDEAIESLSRSHRAVGQAITLHQSGLFALPTKEGKLDWSQACSPRHAIMSARPTASGWS